MYRGHTVGVVIPAYNEEGFVGDSIESVPGFVDRIYVVDDASTDGTWEEIRECAKRLNARARTDGDGVFYPRVVTVQHESNRGVGGAIKTGYLRARDDDIAATAVMGGDGQMEPEFLDSLLDPIVDGRADYVKGNRLLGRTDRGDMPAFRFVGNATLAALTKIASGYWESGDPQSGYTAISGRALDAVNVEDMYEFYGYCNDLLVKLNVAGMRVADVPRPITYGDEESHIRYRSYMPRVAWMLLRNFVWRLRTNYLLFDFRPVVVAYAAGAVGGLLGVAGIAAAAAGGDVGVGAASVVTGLVSVLLLVSAMASDKRENDHLDVVLDDRGRPTREERAGAREERRPSERGSWVRAPTRAERADGGDDRDATESPRDERAAREASEGGT